VAATSPWVRAEVAEARLEWHQRQRADEREAAEQQEVELRRLRALVDAQQAILNELRERVRELETSLRQVAVGTLVAAMIDAIERGSATFPGREIAVADAEIRAALRIGRTGGDIVLASPGIYEPGALSTLRFELRRLPPTRAEEAQAAASASVVVAALALQAGLDEVPFATGDVAAAVQPLTTPAPPAELRAALRRLIAPLRRLAGELPTLAPAVDGLARREALSDPPTTDELGGVAEALGDVAAVLAGRTS
jgi:hypothetical protein